MDNLPDGMSVFDSHAPWNQPIDEPDTCGGCEYCMTKRIWGETTYLCLYDAVVESDVSVTVVDPQDRACSDYEPKE